MKIIIDPYRGGHDTGKNIFGQYEKNILLKLSRYMYKEFIKHNIDVELVRNYDISLTDDERISIINEIKGTNDIIIQNKISEDNEFNIIYSIRTNDKLINYINYNLENNNILIDKIYQRRLSTNPMLDYYSILRNTIPNEAIIIEYNNLNNHEKIIHIIVNAISNYSKREYSSKKSI